MAKLFQDYGFDDYNEKHPTENMTPIEKARTRLNFHGMSDYISFLEKLQKAG